MKRRATTLVELLVGFGVMVVVVGGAWYAFVAASSGGKRVMEYASAMEGIAAIQARLGLDLAGAVVPAGFHVHHPAFRVTDEGRSISFLVAPRHRDPAHARPEELRPTLVTWRAVADGPGRYTIEREQAEGETLSWGRLACEDARFGLLQYQTGTYFEADFLFPGSTSEAVEGPKKFPLRVTRRLRPTAVMSGGALPFPSRHFPDLPTPEGEATRSLLGGGSRVQLERSGG